MTTQAIEPGTNVFQSTDSDTGRTFYWFRTPSGTTGGVAVDHTGNPPTRDEAVLIIPDSGKPFIGYKERKPVLTY